MENFSQTPKPKKIGLLFKVLVASITVFALGVGALVYSVVTASKIKGELASTKQDLAKRQREVAGALDSKIEALENENLKLKEQGYVERDEFNDLADKILAATVIVTSTKEGITLSPTGEITTAKEFDPSGSSGSGFFVRSDGYLATAKHVIEAIGQDNLLVVLGYGKTLPAKLVSTDPNGDIAIIKVEGQNYPSVELGHFENLLPGEEIGFTGFALSSGITKVLVHRGVISAKGTDQRGAKIFTINAFINRGNSGGPVFSAKTGRVVGVVSARQKDKTSEKAISLPPGYAPAVSFGGTDPVRLSVELYNKTLEIVGDVSQVGIGVAYSSDAIPILIPK